LFARRRSFAVIDALGFQCAIIESGVDHPSARRPNSRPSSSVKGSLLEAPSHASFRTCGQVAGQVKPMARPVVSLSGEADHLAERA
jgi:hypothetical protein